MTESQPEFSRPLSVERLGATERVFDIEARPEERQALAERFGILEIPAFKAHLTVKRLGGSGLIRLDGHFVADVVQSCVVTLEPVPAHLEESFTLTFTSEALGEDEEDLVIDPDAEDPPEPIEQGVIDLGEAAAEHLALALDPFPRAPGAEFTAEPDADGAAGAEAGQAPRPSPFAALAALKKK